MQDNSDVEKQASIRRIIWLLEELGLQYELKKYTRQSENKLGPDELKALHPLGRSPVLTDGDLTIPESGGRKAIYRRNIMSGVADAAGGPSRAADCLMVQSVRHGRFEHD